MLLVNFLWERIWLKSGNSNILLLLNSLWERIRLKRESSNMLLLLNFLWERIRLKRANFFDSSCQDSSGVKSAIWHLQSCYNYNHVLCYNHALFRGALQQNPTLMAISKFVGEKCSKSFLIVWQRTLRKVQTECMDQRRTINAINLWKEGWPTN